MSKKRVLMGVVGVDSGQLLICDPCYLDGDHPDLEYDALSEREDQFRQLVYKMGHAGAGVVFNSGLGDGCYEVWGTFEKCGGWGERITKVEIILIDKEDLKILQEEKE